MNTIKNLLSMLVRFASKSYHERTLEALEGAPAWRAAVPGDLVMGVAPRVIAGGGAPAVAMLDLLELYAPGEQMAVRALWLAAHANEEDGRLTAAFVASWFLEEELVAASRIRLGGARVLASSLVESLILGDKEGSERELTRIGEVIPWVEKEVRQRLEAPRLPGSLP